MKRYVLDASALLVFFEGGPGAEVVGSLLEQAAYSRVSLFLSVVNWGEVYYSIWKSRGRQVAETKMVEVSQLPVEVVAVDEQAARRAARWKAECRLPYADCFAASLAEQKKAAVVTLDRDFSLVQPHLEILWVHPPRPG